MARLAGVSVRTLHHYDRVGLLRPGGRTTGNHRVYSPADLERLRRILLYRELDLPIPAIAEVLEEPGAVAEDHLRRQHRLLRARLERTARLLETLEQEMASRAMGLALTAEEQLAVFGTEHLAEHLDEVARSPAAPAAWPDASRRAAAYTVEDWVQIKAEADAGIEAFRAALLAGEPADGCAATTAAEEHRQHLARWFRSCSHVEHVRVAEAYVADPAQAAQWDDVAPGFARYVHDAILANARASASAPGEQLSTTR